MGPCCHGMARPQVADGGKPPIWRVAVNILNKQSDSQQGGGGVLQLGVGQGASNFPLQKLNFYKTKAFTSGLDQYFGTIYAM